MTKTKPENRDPFFSDSGELLTDLFHRAESGPFRRAKQLKRASANRSAARLEPISERHHDIEKTSVTKPKPRVEQTAEPMKICGSKAKKIPAEKGSSTRSKTLVVVLALAIIAVPIIILIGHYAPLAFTEEEQEPKPGRKEIIRGTLSDRQPMERCEETVHLAKREIQPHTPKPPMFFQPNDVAAKVEVVRERWSASYPYSIYLGSFKTVDRAQKAVSVFQEKGISSYWVRIDLGPKGVWFRVFAGHFKSRKEAEAFAKKKNLAKGKSRHTRYANLIGTFRSEGELDKTRLTLFELGCYPYVIGGTNGKYHLFTGAFYQRARAEEQQKSLASRGIDCRLVER